MRLIDADVLTEHIKEFTNISEGYFENPQLLVRVIENQPTAYDVENVVEQLSNAKLGGRCDAGVVAKEIVRNGGKE